MRGLALIVTSPTAENCRDFIGFDCRGVKNEADGIFLAGEEAKGGCEAVCGRCRADTMQVEFKVERWKQWIAFRLRYRC